MQDGQMSDESANHDGRKQQCRGGDLHHRGGSLEVHKGHVLAAHSEWPCSRCARTDLNKPSYDRAIDHLDGNEHGHSRIRNRAELAAARTRCGRMAF